MMQGQAAQPAPAPYLDHAGQFYLENRMLF